MAPVPEPRYEGAHRMLLSTWIAIAALATAFVAWPTQPSRRRFAATAIAICVALVAHVVSFDALRDDTRFALAGETPTGGWEARNIQPLFAKMIAEGLGAELTAAQNEEEIIIMAQRVRAEG